MSGASKGFSHALGSERKPMRLGTVQAETEMQGLDGHRELERLVPGLSPANGVLGAERSLTSI